MKIKTFSSFINEELLVGKYPIKDINKYLDGMSKGLSDKISF